MFVCKGENEVYSILLAKHLLIPTMLLNVHFSIIKPYLQG